MSDLPLEKFLVELVSSECKSSVKGLKGKKYGCLPKSAQSSRGNNILTNFCAASYQQKLIIHSDEKNG